MLKSEDEVVRALKHRFCRIRGSLLSLDLWKCDSTPSAMKADVPGGHSKDHHVREMQVSKKPQSPATVVPQVKVNRQVGSRRNPRELKIQKRVTPKISKSWVAMGCFLEYSQGFSIYFHNPPAPTLRDMEGLNRVFPTEISKNTDFMPKMVPNEWILDDASPAQCGRLETVADVPSNFLCEFGAKV
ncbi:hypothetical protein AMTRI_Chr06g172490 [Amborella trichopoda]